MVVRHSWPRLHSHQAFLPLPDTTSVGFSVPFFVGCQVLATAGATAASARSGVTRRPAQYGQPVPRLVRLSMVVCHSWPQLQRHLRSLVDSVVAFSLPMYYN